MNNRNRAGGIIAKMLREPILQFMLIALLLFILNLFINGAKKSGATQQIVVTQGQIEQISNQYRLVAGRLPSKQELRALVDDFVNEEVFYREAIAIGLDEDDTIVRRRMKQKLTFLAQDTASSEDPSDAQLLDWFKVRRLEYRFPARISFRHVLISQDLRGEQAISDAQQGLLNLQAGAKPESMGDPSVIPAKLSHLSKQRISSLFGENFASSIFAGVEGKWFGPVSSPLGIHLVFITQREPSIDPEFSEIKDKLKVDWIEAKREEAAKNYLARIRQRYSVEVDWPTSTMQGSISSTDSHRFSGNTE
ncbi:peptidyl-prolyl cis-trans isomerase [Neptunicella sp.]|uniref:peptidylprolyl isomerase n=1 Tax=Neptunicella sp. TaxID=2125986 RepID=UPI003F69274F